MTKIKDGDWVVAQSQFGFDTMPVVKITDKLVFCKSGYSNNQRRVRPEDVLFSGSEATAKKLMERLVSSAALAGQECNGARVRQTERDKKIIDAALGDQQLRDDPK